MVLYLIRHGETDWNVQNKIQGDTDIPLNQTGIKQANTLKEVLKNVSFDVCYTSPLERTMTTAKTILEGTCPIIPVPELVERDFGQIEGSAITEVQSKKYWDYELNSQDEGVETVRYLLDRTRTFLLELIQKHPNQTVLLVTHGSTLRALHFNLMGYHTKEDFLKFDVKNCQIFQYKL